MLIFAALAVLVSGCSVIETVTSLVEGTIRSGQPREAVMNIGDLRLEVWCSQAVYEPGRDPFMVGMRVTNEGDDLEILYQEDGPLAQIVVEPPTSSALILEARGEEPGARVELPPGQSFEMEWNLGTRDESGDYYIKGMFWTEKRGEEETATDCRIRY